MRYTSLILLLFFVTISCSRKVEGRSSLERYPSEVYINTCGEIFDHFEMIKDGSEYRYNVESNTFSYLKIQTDRNGCVEKMTYGLRPGGLENIMFRINLRYHMDLKEEPQNNIILFEDYGKTIHVNVTENLFEVYWSVDK
ncbi:MAG: hypothetical protein ABUK01_16580 [Leptospirales bacterium]